MAQGAGAGAATGRSSSSSASFHRRPPPPPPPPLSRDAWVSAAIALALAPLVACCAVALGLIKSAHDCVRTRL
jgi:hypothetical protein